MIGFIIAMLNYTRMVPEPIIFYLGAIAQFYEMLGLSVLAK